MSRKPSAEKRIPQEWLDSGYIRHVGGRWETLTPEEEKEHEATSAGPATPAP